MEILRWLWDDSAQNPRPHGVYDLIRVYARPSKVENQPPPDTFDAREATPTHDKNRSPGYTIYDEPDQSQVSSYLGVTDSALLRVLKSQGPKDTEYDSYFLVIVREKSKEIDWKKTPYLQVNKPWDYPTDDRKYKAQSKRSSKASSTLRSELFVRGKSKEILDCFNHQVGEYQNQRVDGSEGRNGKVQKSDGGCRQEASITRDHSIKARISR